MLSGFLGYITNISAYIMLEVFMNISVLLILISIILSIYLYRDFFKNMNLFHWLLRKSEKPAECLLALVS